MLQIPRFFSCFFRLGKLCELNQTVCVCLNTSTQNDPFAALYLQVFSWMLDWATTTGRLLRPDGKLA